MRSLFPPMWLGSQMMGRLGKRRRNSMGMCHCAVYHADFADTGIVDALYCAYPQFEVGIHGIFDEDGNVDSFQGIGDFLHREGVGRGAGSNPQYVDTVFEGFKHMVLVGHFGGDIHAGFFFYAFEPG